MNVNRQTVSSGQLFAETRRRPFQPQDLQFRGVKAVRHRLNVGRKIRNLLADFADLLLELGR